MKIVLAEDRGAQPPGERTFTAEVVRLGRDAAICQFVFDHDEWPMVSRRHAEIRLRKGRCLLVDTNSRYGTFLNGQRLRANARARLRDLSPARGVMFIAPNALYNSKPAPSGAECEWKRCAHFAPNGADILEQRVL